MSRLNSIKNGGCFNAYNENWMLKKTNYDHGTLMYEEAERAKRVPKTSLFVIQFSDSKDDFVDHLQGSHQLRI